MMRKSILSSILAGAALMLIPGGAAAQSEATPISLGIQFTGSPDDGGAKVVQLLPDRTGAAVGFKVGDILTEVDGKPVSPDVIMAYLKEKKIGDDLNFKVKRAGAVVELTGKAIAVPENSKPLPPIETQQQ